MSILEPADIPHIEDLHANKPEPSRLEIAAMILADWSIIADNAKEVISSAHIALDMADALIKAAKGGE